MVTRARTACRAACDASAALSAAGFVLACGLTPVAAQVQPDDATARLVSQTSEAFLDQIVIEDFAAERAFLSPGLAALVSPGAWQSMRAQTIQTAGKTQRYSVHAVTYYQDKTLLAAVDFSGPAGKPDTFICGFLLWELPDRASIGLMRLEQNVVAAETFRQLPVEVAAQNMADWRCPVPLIETTLGISVN
jgi:hypothetical protein